MPPRTMRARGIRSGSPMWSQCMWLQRENISGVGVQCTENASFVPVNDGINVRWVYVPCGENVCYVVVTFRIERLDAADNGRRVSFAVLIGRRERCIRSYGLMRRIPSVLQDQRGPSPLLDV